MFAVAGFSEEDRYETALRMEASVTFSGLAPPRFPYATSQNKAELEMRACISGSGAEAQKIVRVKTHL